MQQNTISVDNLLLYWYSRQQFAVIIGQMQIWEEVYQIFRYSNNQQFQKSAYLLKMELMVVVLHSLSRICKWFRTQLQQKVQSQVSSWQKKIDACSTDEKK